MRINHEAGIRPELVSRGANVVHSLPLLFVDRCLSYINRLVKSTIVALKSTLYYLFSERLLSYPQHKGQKTEGGLANQSTQRFPTSIGYPATQAYKTLQRVTTRL